MAVKELPDFPVKANLLTEIYQPLPIVNVVVDWDSFDAPATAEKVVKLFSTALGKRDTNALRTIFITGRSYWRDTLAITSHLRTFKDSAVIAPILTELSSERRISEIGIISGSEQVVSVSETLVSPPDVAPENLFLPLT